MRDNNHIIRCLKITSWNINAVNNKLENVIVQHALMSSDIIFLNETKTAERFTLPGYVCYQSDTDNPNRGGCAVLLKHYLVGNIARMDLSHKDLVQLELKCLPDATIVGCYIPPCDSPYFNMDTYAYLQELTKQHGGKGMIVLGDLNARFGNAKARFLEDKPKHISWVYEDSPDPTANPNSNARHTITALQSLLLLNNLKTRDHYFKGALTFRQGNRFISELDVCLVSPELVDCICDYSVEQRLDLPSNHSPITVSVDLSKCAVDMSSMLTRAKELGSHAVLCHYNSRPIGKHQVRISDLDSEAFNELIHTVTPPVITADSDVDEVISKMNDTLYSLATKARLQRQLSQSSRQTSTRWEWLLKEGDPKAIWKAIGWDGKCDPQKTSETPSEQDFKLHFEKLLNPTEANPTMSPDLHESPYIPITDDPISAAEVEEAIHQTKGNKSGGISGISPGLLKLLPSSWIFSLAFLFTWVFTLNIYPSTWQLSWLDLCLEMLCGR